MDWWVFFLRKGLLYNSHFWIFIFDSWFSTIYRRKYNPMYSITLNKQASDFNMSQIQFELIFADISLTLIWLCQVHYNKKKFRWVGFKLGFNPSHTNWTCPVAIDIGSKFCILPAKDSWGGHTFPPMDGRMESMKGGSPTESNMNKKKFLRCWGCTETSSDLNNSVPAKKWAIDDTSNLIEWAWSLDHYRGLGFWNHVAHLHRPSAPVL